MKIQLDLNDLVGIYIKAYDSFKKGTNGIDEFKRLTLEKLSGDNKQKAESYDDKWWKNKIYAVRKTISRKVYQINGTKVPVYRRAQDSKVYLDKKYVTEISKDYSPFFLPLLWKNEESTTTESVANQINSYQF